MLGEVPGIGPVQPLWEALVKVWARHDCFGRAPLCISYQSKTASISS